MAKTDKIVNMLMKYTNLNRNESFRRSNSTDTVMRDRLGNYEADLNIGRASQQTTTSYVADISSIRNFL